VGADVVKYESHSADVDELLELGREVDARARLETKRKLHGSVCADHSVEITCRDDGMGRYFQCLRCVIGEWEFPVR
jgi:hypothetical protein